MTNRLTVPQVIAMNEVLCIQSGEPAALLDRGGLEAAIERPWSGFGDTELFPSLYEKAAARDRVSTGLREREQADRVGGGNDLP